MLRTQRIFSILSIFVLLMSAAWAQDPAKQAKNKTLAASNSVIGSGAAGQITKWTGVSGSNAFTIGDSTITEDKFGKVGIGTTAPTSSLTVQGMIETTLGGIKFPDGTTQTTSTAGALFGVARDATLNGNGTTGSPLSVGVPLTLSRSAGENAIITATNTSINAGVGVRGVGGSRSGALLTVNVGVVGESSTGVGVFGEGGAGGVSGSGITNTTGDGGFGLAGSGGDGRGVGRNSGDGIFAVGGIGTLGATNGLAGNFFGNVDVQGTLTKTMGTFKIDHPLDPENKYLYHSFVESPEMMNIYHGNVTTDPNGEAVVEMPDYFDALNKNVHYQLTVIGTFAQAIIASKMKNNHFVIRTNAPNVEVSWTVTGVRQDGYAEKHRVQVEELKPEKERGSYLHPEVFNQPEEKSIEWARHPELMEKLKQQRLDAEARIKKQQQR